LPSCQDAASDAEVTKRTAVVRLGLERASRIYPVIAGAAALTLVVLVATGALPRFGLLWMAGVPLFVRAAQVARRNFDRPFELVPAHAYTAVGHLAGSLALAVGLVWAGPGGGLHPGVPAGAVGGPPGLLYYHRAIGRLSRAFYGVRDAVAKS